MDAGRRPSVVDINWNANKQSEEAANKPSEEKKEKTAKVSKQLKKKPTFDPKKDIPRLKIDRSKLEKKEKSSAGEEQKAPVDIEQKTESKFNEVIAPDSLGSLFVLPSLRPDSPPKNEVKRVKKGSKLPAPPSPAELEEKKQPEISFVTPNKTAIVTENKREDLVKLEMKIFELLEEIVSNPKADRSRSSSISNEKNQNNGPTAAANVPVQFLRFIEALNIDKDYFFGNVLLGKEEISTFDITSFQRALWESTAEHCPEKKEACEELLRKLEAKEKHDHKYRPTKEKYFDSYYLRYLFELYLLGNGSYEEAKNAYVPAPINFREHKFTNAEGVKEWSFFRVGVMTDLPNGFTHLRELKELSRNPASLRDKVTKIEAIDPEKISSKIDNPVLRDKVKKQVAGAIENAVSELYHVEKTIENRREILSAQMWPIVVAHLMNNPGVIKAGSFTFFHLGLLNEETDKIDPTGWVHNEAYELLDMAEIYNEFRNKKVFFDKGLEKQYIDTEGNLHMPKFNDKLPASIGLHPIFLNTSVQGNEKNTPVQKKENDVGLVYIEAYLSSTLSKEEYKELTSPGGLLYQIEATLRNGESNYELADKITQLGIKYKIPFSLGCLSAKDRTGLVSAETATSEAIEQAEAYVEKVVSVHTLSSAQKKQLKEYMKSYKQAVYDQMLNKESSTAAVTKQNTGSVAVKCSALEFPNMSKIERAKFGIIKQIKNPEPLVKEERGGIREALKDTPYPISKGYTESISVFSQKQNIQDELPFSDNE